MDYSFRYSKDMIVLLILVAVYLSLCMKLNTFILDARQTNVFLVSLK